jgi:protein-tyrosine-phosphatase
MRSVLFVCTANICRSPMAMGLFYAQVMPSACDWRIASVGTFAAPGYPAAHNTLVLLKYKGIDLSGHRSAQITWEIMSDYNLILTMERGQKEALQVAFPDQAKKVYLMAEMIGENWEIADPVGGALVEFEETSREIEHILTTGYPKICTLAGSSIGDA